MNTTNGGGKDGREIESKNFLRRSSEWFYCYEDDDPADLQVADTKPKLTFVERPSYLLPSTTVERRIQVLRLRQLQHGKVKLKWQTRKVAKDFHRSVGLPKGKELPSEYGSSLNSTSHVFSEVFTAEDCDDLLRSHSATTEAGCRARRKLILAATHDKECFRELQRLLRQRRISTHMAIGQLLLSDSENEDVVDMGINGSIPDKSSDNDFINFRREVLKPLARKVVDRKVSVSREIQEVHRIVLPPEQHLATSSKSFSLLNKGIGEATVEVLKSLKGLVVNGSSASTMKKNDANNKLCSPFSPSAAGTPSDLANLGYSGISTGSSNSSYGATEPGTAHSVLQRAVGLACTVASQASVQGVLAPSTFASAGSGSSGFSDSTEEDNLCQSGGRNGLKSISRPTELGEPMLLSQRQQSASLEQQGSDFCAKVVSNEAMTTESKAPFEANIGAVVSDVNQTEEGFLLVGFPSARSVHKDEEAANVGYHSTKEIEAFNILPASHSKARLSKGNMSNKAPRRSSSVANAAA